MKRQRTTGGIGKAAHHLLAVLAARAAGLAPPHGSAATADDVDLAKILIDADLACRAGDGILTITQAGLAHLARLRIARSGAEIDPFLGQHLSLARAELSTPEGRLDVAINAAESPLAWLARRKGRDGRPLIEPSQLQAGERLRADFTRAQLMPRITANWTSAVAQDRRGAGSQSATLADTVVAARQSLRHALDSVGPEFGGLLLDVCCFLKRLEDIERERAWPLRSAKVVLQLGLDRLARHYGYGAVARGPARAAVRTWLAPDAAFAVIE